jgi:hypothetical protein
MLSLQFIKYTKIFPFVAFKLHFRTVDTFIFSSMFSFTLSPRLVRDLSFRHLWLDLLDRFSFVISTKNLHKLAIFD